MSQNALSGMVAIRKVVIVGPPPVQVLDVTGPLEVFGSADGYDVTIATPGADRTLQTNRPFALTNATPIIEITGLIDTLVVAGGRERRQVSTIHSSSHGSERRQSGPGAWPQFAPAPSCSEQLDSWMANAR